jgi:hypothetical protein
MSENQTVDFHRLLLEIEDEVRAKRANGELPVDVERELDMVFARFAPAGALGGNFEQLLERAEQQAYIDLLAPNESARPGVGQVKRVVQKTVRWYMRYVVDQITGFAHTLTKVIRQLADRVDRIEQLAAPDDELASALLKTRPAFDAAWVTPVIEHVKSADGRVLHARCGSGDLVAAMKAAGVDAYGVDPLSELVVTGTAGDSGLDLRVDSELAHLRLVAPGSLGGLVLSGGVDILPRGAQVELIDLALTALKKGGRMALITTDPVAWQRVHHPIETDLAPGRPLHAPTWLHLFGERGYTSIDVVPGARHGDLDHVPGTDETAAAMNANLDLLNELLFPPASWLITAVR